MDRASTVIRRSGVKLRSSLGVAGGGHADLQMVITQLKDAKASAKSLAQSELAAWQDITKWSLREENRAIQDALCQVLLTIISVLGWFRAAKPWCHLRSARWPPCGPRHRKS